MRNFLLPVAMALALSACGGGSDSGAPATTVPPVDAFFGVVQATISTPSETGEPAAVEAVVVTTPDDTEPTPI